MAQDYLEGASLRQLADDYGCNDHKPLGRHLLPYVEKLGGKMRTQAESQGVRREREWKEFKRKPGEIWVDFALVNNRRRK